ncbi:hypothetical protein K2X14_08195 [Acetobacter sp. TBRC 12305]|uniref:Uncharacterized protein n=2 Tax=Acetobacter garciniae TaxID=2817435 RepID=A0A939HPZ5_9PROT|nr:hypothetical protein [Acetobacter garciniae]MBX0344813.1 hypothetical protein [Acetobacter garciniae]
MFPPRHRSGARTRHMLLALLCGMVLPCGLAAFPAPGSAAYAADASAADDPYGDWVGTLVQDMGTDCPVNGTSLMQIETHKMIFVPETGSLILRGVPDKAKQHYHAQLVMKDAKNQTLPLVFEARPVGDTFEGVYGTPECRAHVTLRRPTSHALHNFLGR